MSVAQPETLRSKESCAAVAALGSMLVELQLLFAMLLVILAGCLKPRPEDRVVGSRGRRPTS